MSNYVMKHTLCWSCAKSCGLCAWSRDFKPVPGWVAEPTIINNAATTRNGRNVPPFKVLECPEFVRG